MAGRIVTCGGPTWTTAHFTPHYFTQFITTDTQVIK